VPDIVGACIRFRERNVSTHAWSIVRAVVLFAPCHFRA
jgi:hypothetical protein